MQVLDPSGKPASGVVVVKSLRVDMGPDKMKDMTTPAKALPGGKGMDYIPVYADEVQRPPGAIKLTADKIQHAGVRLSRVTRQTLSRSIRAPGRVAADENRQGVLTARFKGFVEKLYIAQTGDVVRKGQPMMRVWVEDTDVQARIADYVGANSSGAKDRAAQSAAILRQYAITSADLAQMARTGQPTLGQTALVSFRDAPGETFTGKVIQLYPDTRHHHTHNKSPYRTDQSRRTPASGSVCRCTYQCPDRARTGSDGSGICHDG